MATKYTGDEKARVFKAYSVNHPEWGAANEYQWWKNARSKTAIPWGTDRTAAITAAATALTITLTETAPWAREQEFWSLYTSVTPAA